MKNNMIDYYEYCEHITALRSIRRAARNRRIQFWCFTIADTVVTLSVSICMMFCIYLAYTML